MQKNYVSIADFLPPDHPLGRSVETTMADLQANYEPIFLQRKQDIIASLSVSAADSGSVDGLNADSAFAPVPLQEGSRVRIENLQASAAMNGRSGVICSAFNRESGRWIVQLDADGANLPCRLSIRPANLKAIQTSSAQNSDMDLDACGMCNSPRISVAELPAEAPSDNITSNSMFDSHCHDSLQLPPALAPVAFQLFGALYQLHSAFVFQNLGSAKTNSLLLRTRSLLPPYLYIATLKLSVTKALSLNDGNKIGLKQRLQTIGGACHGKVALLMTQRVENCNHRKRLVESILRRMAVRQVAAMVTGLQMRAEALRSRGKCMAAVKILKQAIALGSLPSRADLADMLFEGREGFPQDRKTAFELVYHGTQLGCHHCQGVLSKCYATTEEQDIFFSKLPMECYKGAHNHEKHAQESAAKGSRYGQFAMARKLFLRGDFASAEALAKLAAEQNHDESQWLLGYIYVNHKKNPIDIIEGLRWLKLSAAQGLGAAM
jgi:TPR repeat protein